MDVPQQAGGGTRRRRRARRAKTQRGGAEGDGMAELRTLDVAVEKAAPPASVAPAATPAAVAVPAPQAGGAKPTVAKQLALKPAVKPTVAAPVVVLAPAKKKAKIMLVSKKDAAAPATAAKAAVAKTFKAKRVRVTIDNTARTQKRRRQVLRSVDSLTEEQLREQAVKFGLSRADSVKKVPQDLLRKMLKDYYAMRKGFL
jgi:hypothetical protein